MAVLVLAEHDLGALSPAMGRVVAAAEALGGPVDVLVAGQNAQVVADQAALLPGVGRVRIAEAVAPTAETLTPLLASLAGDYDHIIAVSAALGRDVIPRLAASLDLMPVTDVTAIHGPNRFERPIYAGNAIETVVSEQPKHLLTLRASAFPPAKLAPAGDPPIEPVAGAALAPLVQLLAAHRTEGDRPDLATAKIVVGGGIAVGSAEGFRLIEELAAVLGAAVGATRAAVDAGYAPNDWQVGQTGKIIAPDLYIAIGVSGALQHLAGIQGTKKIVAINTDAEAPLMKLADYRLVGDLFAVVPALITELKRVGG
ncbi:MAG TPA: FAD-binding protein [Devosiaceae bacterium]|nr:FAD-binding protein [Devosiaceae bacterium]